MNCPKCGSENLEGEVYCLKCDSELKELGKDASSVFACPYCGTENYDTATECKSCHKEIQSPFVYCTRCGRRNLASDGVCRECESPLPDRLELETPPRAPPLPGSLSCPSCGRQMDKGFIIAPDKGSFHGVRWSESKDILWPYVGEPVALGNQIPANMNVPAFRCPACKLVLMKY